MDLTLHCLQEDTPAEKWQALFNKAWPFYRQWFLSEGIGLRKGYLTCESELKRYMPELMPIYQQLVILAGGGDLEARFLSMYCPPAYMTGCSQLARNHGAFFLVRNYDFSPVLFENNLLYTKWLKPVIGMGDCTWGLLDGMNADGLAASLAFGGRKATGTGFGIPLIIRYLLETSSTVQEAINRVMHLPSHMVYTITLADALGHAATVYLSPDRAPILSNHSYATNHQQQVEWPEYAMVSATVQREKVLEAIQATPNQGEDAIIQQFLQPPLFNYNYQKKFGTLYTIQYKLATKQLRIFWPDQPLLTQSFEAFLETDVPYKLPVSEPVN